MQRIGSFFLHHERKQTDCVLTCTQYQRHPVCPYSSQADSWRPFTPALRQDRGLPEGSNGVYASAFTKGSETVYTLVNRHPSDATKVVLSVDCTAPGQQRYFDLYRGREFSEGASVCNVEAGKAELSFQIEGLGFGAILVLKTVGENPAPPPSEVFLQTMATMTSAELRSYSTVREFLPQTMVPAPRTPPPPAAGLPGMVAPDTASQPYMFAVSGNIQQGDTLPTIVDVQFPWESSPRRGPSANDCIKINLECQS